MSDNQDEQSLPAMPSTPGLALLQGFFNTFDSIRNQLKVGHDRATIPLTSITSLGTEGVALLRRHLQSSMNVEYDFIVDASVNCVVVVPARQMSQSFTESTCSQSTTCDDDDDAPDTDDHVAFAIRPLAKVPRPANAFILYRKDWHNQLATQHPHLHNNEISKIVGRKWRNESAGMKSWYKQRAEEVREQHAIDNPGYSYQPRKPSEKKRRVSRKRLERASAKIDTVNNLAEMIQRKLPEMPHPIHILDEGLARMVASESLPADVPHTSSYGMPQTSFHHDSVPAPSQKYFLMGSGNEGERSISSQLAEYNTVNQQLPFASDVTNSTHHQRPTINTNRCAIAAEPSVSGYLEQNTYYELPDLCDMTDTSISSPLENLYQLSPPRAMSTHKPTFATNSVDALKEANRTLELEREDFTTIFGLDETALIDPALIGRTPHDDATAGWRIEELDDLMFDLSGSELGHAA